MSTRTEVLKQFYAALNRNDVESAIRDFDPDIFRNEFEGTPMAGTFRGIAELKQNFTNGRATWAEGTCDPEEFLESGDKVVVYVHVHVRQHGATDWIDARIADGFAFRGDTILEFHSFLERAQSLKWAGLEG